MDEQGIKDLIDRKDIALTKDDAIVSCLYLILQELKKLNATNGPQGIIQQDVPIPYYGLEIVPKKGNKPNERKESKRKEKTRRK